MPPNPTTATPTGADEHALFARCQQDGDRAACETLARRYLPLARSLARRYENRHGEPFEDLVQVASLGLVKAINGFDPAVGARFSTYAVPTILGELRRHFRDRSWSVRVPRGIKETWLRVERAQRELSATLDRSPTVDDVAAYLSLSLEEVLEAMQAGQAHRATSMERPLAPHGDDADATVGEMLGADDDGFLRAEDRMVVQRAARVLSDRDRRIVHLRFADDLTQAEIAALVGLSQMQISRILRSSLERLRHASSDEGAEADG